MVQIQQAYQPIDRDEDTDIERDEMTIEGRDIRVYKKNDSYIPSMSTLKQFDPNGGNDYSDWEDRNNGRNGSPHYKDLKTLLALRGTLIHARTLSNFTKDEIYGEEEKEAEWAINNYEEYREKELDVSTEWIPENVPYFNEGESPKDWVDRTVPLIEDAMMKMLSDVKRVIHVEKFLISEELGLSGQVDLVVETISGDIEVIDLKATSSIKHSHKQQSTGYAKILEVEHGLDVDNCRLVRANTRYADKEGECDTQVLKRGMDIRHKSGFDVSWHEDENVYEELEEMANIANCFVQENKQEIDEKFKT